MAAELTPGVYNNATLSFTKEKLHRIYVVATFQGTTNLVWIPLPFIPPQSTQVHFTIVSIDLQSADGKTFAPKKATITIFG